MIRIEDGKNLQLPANHDRTNGRKYRNAPKKGRDTCIQGFHNPKYNDYIKDVCEITGHQMVWGDIQRTLLKSVPKRTWKQNALGKLVVKDVFCYQNLL
jgi:hypothetical protein